MTRHLPIAERDRAEAACVTTTGSGHQFELQLGHLCNNRCVFCVSGQLTELKIARTIALEPIVRAIEEARARGARRLTFLGGEPTLHKGFLRALERAVELGFEEVVIFTNGVMFPHPGFLDRVVALGRFEWRVSIQGGNEEAHVAVTGRKDSFARILHGLAALRARGQDVTANLCVNERSYRSLPDYPALVREYGVRQLHVDVVRPDTAGARTDAYLRAIMPRYASMAPYLDAMLAEFERLDPGYDVNVGNLPYCVLPRWSHRIHHGGEPTETTGCEEDGLRAVAFDKYEWQASMRRHPPGCDSCALRPRCAGVFTKYLELYGDGEFRPLTLARLRAEDPEQRGFVLLAAPALAPLLEATAPAPWRREGLAQDHAARLVELRLLAAGGGRVTLRFEPVAPRRDEAALRTDCYQLVVAVDPGVPADALERLLAWAAERLGAADGVAVTEPLDVAATVGRLLRPQALRRGRARVEGMVARALRRGRFGAWRCTATRDGEGGGAVLHLRGPQGRLDVALEPEARAGRSHVSLDVRLGEGTAVEAARPVVAELLRALEGPQP